MQNLVTNVLSSDCTGADHRAIQQVPLTYQVAKQTRFALLMVGVAAIAMAGCGGSSKKSTTPAADFSLAVAPSSITVVPGGAPQTLTVGTTPTSGFTGSVSLAVGTLPTGVTATPTTLSISPGTLGQFTITASAAAAAGTASISVTGTSGMLSHNASAALTVSTPAVPVTTASLSAGAFDFGNNLVNNTLSKTVVVVSNTGGGSLTLSPTLTGDASYSIVSGQSCGAELAAGASCNMVLNYVPTVASTPASQNAVLNLGFVNVPTGTPQTVAISGTSAVLSAGQVSTTNNPQVARYTMTLPFPGSVTVNFGTTTDYGLKTWSQSTDTAGGQVTILVAGMKASTAYHMQAAVAFSNGLTATDADHTFTTKAIPANMNITMTAGAAAGMTPQPGLELLQSIGKPSGVLVSDLDGNILWTYATPGPATDLIDGVKTLPNGNFLMTIGVSSGVPLASTIPPASILEMREVNLAGDTVREISINDLNAQLATATCAECKVSVDTFHHDVEPLPNGHWLVMANTIMALSPTSTPKLTNLPPQNVQGDVIIDLDQNLHPVWVWNQFKHLDPNRHPFMFPDWTHSNAVVYSPDDGNILVSIRHQNWVVKVDYANGSGSGDILWRLGEGGDLALAGGSDPQDWQYAQHAPSFTSSNTSGVFSLTLMDNGDDRIFPASVTCNNSGPTPCFYTTIPIFQIDESAKTATLTFHQILPNSLYSFFGGNAEQLANGNMEYDLCGLGASGVGGSTVYEVTQESTPQTVWTMHVTNANLYRATRMPSFYPGVQW